MAGGRSRASGHWQKVQQTSKQGWWDGSLDKDICSRAWQPFDPWDPRGWRRGPAPANWPLTLTWTHAVLRVCMPVCVCTHTHAHNIDKFIKLYFLKKWMELAKNSEGGKSDAESPTSIGCSLPHVDARFESLGVCVCFSLSTHRNQQTIMEPWGSGVPGTGCGEYRVNEVGKREQWNMKG